MAFLCFCFLSLCNELQVFIVRYFSFLSAAFIFSVAENIRIFLLKFKHIVLATLRLSSQPFSVMHPLHYHNRCIIIIIVVIVIISTVVVIIITTTIMLIITLLIGAATFQHQIDINLSLLSITRFLCKFYVSLSIIILYVLSTNFEERSGYWYFRTSEII